MMSTPFPPPLVSDTLGALDHVRSLDRFTPERREILAEAIIADLDRWGAPDEARRSANALRYDSGCAVVTGQQAGIAGGPLYTIYKALGTIVAARTLQEHRTDLRIVPLFWIESDDHDFDEARALGLIDRNGAHQTIHYDDGDRLRRSIGDRPISPRGIERLLQQLREVLPETDFIGEAFELLVDSYRADNGATLADGFARFLYRLLGSTPLIIVSSRNPVMKRLAVDILEMEAHDPDPMYRALEKTTRKNRMQGMPTPIDPKKGSLFLTHQGERRSLDVDDDGYVARGTGVRYSRDDVARIARETPERLSPNVALRPVVQDAAIPTMLYLAGPTERAYHGQLGDVYSRFGLPQPAVAPRPSALLLEPKAVRAIEGGPLDLAELLQRDLDISSRLIDPTASEAIEKTQIASVQRIRETWDGWRQMVMEIDPTLEKAIGAGSAAGVKEMENLARKLRAALKRRQETSIRRLEGIRAILLPGGMPQERGLNVIGFIARYGLAAVRAALGQIVPTEGLCVVRLDLYNAAIMLR